MSGLRIGQGYDVHAFTSGDHVVLRLRGLAQRAGVGLDRLLPPSTQVVEFLLIDPRRRTAPARALAAPPDLPWIDRCRPGISQGSCH